MIAHLTWAAWLILACNLTTFNTSRGQIMPAQSSPVAHRSSMATAAEVPATGECTLARERYSTLNQPVLLEKKGVVTQITPEAMQKRTETITEFITRVILARLSDTKSPEAIRSYLECMQEGVNGAPSEDGVLSSPRVFIRELDKISVAVVSMTILRGANAIADTQDLVQTFVLRDGAWKQTGQSGQDYDANDFRFAQLHSPVPGELWFLLSGFHIGDTGARLRLEVLAVSNKDARTVWD